MKYIRRCQECGYEQEAKDPATYSNESWHNTKCKFCKSSALDYGSQREDNYALKSGW